MTKTPLFKRLSAITNVLLKKHDNEDAPTLGPFGARDRGATAFYEVGQNGLSSNDNGSPERDRRLVGEI